MQKRNSLLIIDCQEKAKTHVMKLDFCYLCGEVLYSGLGQVCSTDHIIPRSLRGESPPNPPDQWSPTLRVHNNCEKNKKMKEDSVLKNVHAIHSNNPTAEDFKRVKNISLQAGMQIIGKEIAVPVISGMGGINASVANWVAGLHALLYSEFVSASNINVFPPVPAFCSANASESLANSEQLVAIRSKIFNNYADDYSDRIISWGGQVRYYCIWHKMTLPHDIKIKFVGFWYLYISIALEWSESVTSSVRPWNGDIFVEDLPKGVIPIQLPVNHIEQSSPAV